jgi:hypothetical protein
MKILGGEMTLTGGTIRTTIEGITIEGIRFFSGALISHATPWTETC